MNTNAKWNDSIYSDANLSAVPIKREIDIYSESDLKTIIAAAEKLTVADFAETRSTEENKRLAILRDLNDGFEGPGRRLLLGSTSLVQRLERLNTASPAFQAVTDLFRREALSSIRTSAPMRMTPIILLGAPGIGKTYLTNALANALQVPFASIAMSSCDDVGDIVGHSLSWKAARPGLVATTLLECGSACPAILVDEIDKASVLSHADRPSDVWHQLLEPENAQRFRDSFLGLDLRADYIFWLATANSLEKLPATVLDRCLVISIDPPSPEASRVIAEKVFAAFARDRGYQKRLPRDAIEFLAAHNPRRMKKILLLAAGFAAEGGCSISLDDLKKAQAIVGGEGCPAQRKFGFI
jgi:ATP-dependent Lon protease